MMKRWRPCHPLFLRASTLLLLLLIFTHCTTKNDAFLRLLHTPDNNGRRSSVIAWPISHSNDIGFFQWRNTQQAKNGYHGLFGRLPRTHAEEQARVEYVQKRFNLTDNEADELIKNKEGVVLSYTTPTLASKLDFCQDELRFNRTVLKKMMFKKKTSHTLLRCSNQRIKAKLACFKTSFDLDDDDLMGIARAGCINPAAFSIRPETLEEKFMWFRQRLYFTDRQIAKLLLQTDPRVLNLPIGSLEPKVDWLGKRFGLSGKDLGSFIMDKPMLLTLKSEETIEPKLVWLQENLHLSNEELLSYVCSFPNILTWGVDTLEEKLEYFQEILGEEEGREMVRSNPRLFTYGLKRYKTRVKDAEEIELSITLKLMRVQLALYTDEQWFAYLTRRQGEA